ncbi:hypothetical protein KY331_04420 [Candidatus Woesearchaeota archaeon]|nr:hypothetical protein [Candidatus Woesearchaeota archaeon]
MKTKAEKQKELFAEENWQAVADLGRVVKDTYDTVYNYAVSMLIQDACNRRQYMRAFEIADKYKTWDGWHPELVAIHLRNEHGLDGKADKLFKEYMKTKAATSEESSSTQQPAQ